MNNKIETFKKEFEESFKKVFIVKGTEHLIQTNHIIFLDFKIDFNNDKENFNVEFKVDTLHVLDYDLTGEWGDVQYNLDTIHKFNFKPKNLEDGKGVGRLLAMKLLFIDKVNL